MMRCQIFYFPKIAGLLSALRTSHSPRILTLEHNFNDIQILGWTGVEFQAIAFGLLIGGRF